MGAGGGASGSSGSSGAIRSWGSDVVAVLPAWITARAVVLVGWVVAEVVAGSRPGPEPTALGHGLIAWDGTHYRAIVEAGYGAGAPESLRFFPLFPLLGRGLDAAMGPVDAGPALVLLANVAALVAMVLLRRLVLHERRSQSLADTAVWVLAVFPASFVLVFAYSEALFLALAIGTFLALRRKGWWIAAGLGLLAALARPTGVLLVLPAAVEVWRHRGSSKAGVLPKVSAVVGPLVGAGLFLAYSGARHDSWREPFSSQSGFRGDLVDPFTRVFRGIGDLLGEESLGDGLHLPFALGLLLLAVLTFRYWPASYGVFAAASVAILLTTENWNSIERYGLGAFPLLLTLAVLAQGRFRDPVVIVSSAGMAALTSLALLGEYVP